LANSSWGQIERDEHGNPRRWVQKWPDISPVAPELGLCTYTSFVVLWLPMTKGSSEDQRMELRAQRREMLWAFTDPGQPGEALRPRLEQMQAALKLPEALRGSETAEAAGLTGDTLRLLPSFMHMVRELKRAGRSFTLMFRTFGEDLQHIKQEFNALCEGRHPLFPADDKVVLDGSDGQPDYRMCLDSADTCGTFFRNPLNGDLIALAMGTTMQPKKIEEGVAFFEQLAGVQLHCGIEAVAGKYAALSTERRTLALRDYYKGWAATESTSRGGKPFFPGPLNDPRRHCIFFDDHITTGDPKIVDPINSHHWPRRFGIGQLFGSHLVQAQPLESIVQREYFIERLHDCEAKRLGKMQNWAQAQRLLGDLQAIQALLQTLVDPFSQKSNSSVRRTSCHYVPWRRSKSAMLYPSEPTFDEDQEDSDSFIPEKPNLPMSRWASC